MCRRARFCTGRLLSRFFGKLPVVAARFRRHNVVSGERCARRVSHSAGDVLVAELAFRDGIMDRIRLREQRFDERAYLFVLSALEFCQQRLPERRHITGRELSIAFRALALDRFGVMSGVVLESWGLKSTADLGDVVFALV